MDSLLNGNFNLNSLLSLSSLPYILNHQQNITSALQLAATNALVNESLLANNIHKSNNYKNNNNDSLEDANKKMNKNEDNNESEYSRERPKRFDSFNRICISYPRDATEYELKNAFKKFGKLQDVHIIQDRYTRADKGIAYLQYMKASEAAKAYEEMNGRCLNSNYTRPVTIYIAPASSEPPLHELKKLDFYQRMSKVFVVVDKRYNKYDLIDDFKKYGKLLDVQLMIDKYTGENRGFGIIKYSKASEASKAIEECDEKYIARFAKKNIKEHHHCEYNSSKYNNYYDDDDQVESVSNISDDYYSVDMENNEDYSGQSYKALRNDSDCSKKFQLENFRIKIENNKRQASTSSSIENFCIKVDNNKRGKSPDRKILIPGDDQKDNLKKIPSTSSCSNSIISSSSSSCSPRASKTSPVILKVNAKKTNEEFLKKMFDLIPGLVEFKPYSSLQKTDYLVKYDTESAAAYAIKKMDRFELSNGERIYVEYYGSRVSKITQSKVLEQIKLFIEQSNQSVNRENLEQFIKNNLKSIVSSFPSSTFDKVACAVSNIPNNSTKTQSADHVLNIKTECKSNSPVSLNEDNQVDSTVTSSDMELTKTNSNRFVCPTKLSTPKTNVITVAINCRDEIEKDLFCKIMKHFNNIIAVDLNNDKKTGYVNFINELDALLAVNTLNEREIAGNYFKAKIETQKNESSSRLDLYKNENSRRSRSPCYLENQNSGKVNNEEYGTSKKIKNRHSTEDAVTRKF